MSYVASYAGFLRKFLQPKKNVRVVFDSSNGTTSLVLKELFKERSLVRAKLINQKLDGNFPAHGPNPLVWGADWQLDKEVKKEKADCGVIFDSDGDRAFFVDDKGRVIDPDQVAYFLMQEFEGPYVFDVTTGWLVTKESPRLRSDNTIRPEPVEGLPFIISKVGHLFIKKAMRKNSAFFGAERSGHYYFKDFFYAESGILAAIKMMNIVGRSGETRISTWIDAELSKYYRIPETNFEVKSYEAELRKIEDLYKDRANKVSKIDGLTMEFGSPLTDSTGSLQASSGQNSESEFWFNLRTSNTESLLRLNMEATSREVLEREVEELDKILRSGTS